jgi:ubiquitin C-terminal hydrolase
VAIHRILIKEIYDPKNFLNYFREISGDFFSQSCSQNFIRTLLKRLDKEIVDQSKECMLDKIQYHPQNQNNEYKKFSEFLQSNNFFTESKLLSIFSGMTKSHSKGMCIKCHNEIEDFSFSYFIDLNLYLDSIKYKCDFNIVLYENYGKNNNLVLNCPICKQEITIKEETKFIKLPEILIFTLERYQGPTNNVEIYPSELLDMSPYLDASLKSTNAKYELFAINIRLGNTKNYGHEICQVKRNGIWYEINDTFGKKINSISNFDSSNGLFYKKKQY